MTPSLAPAPSSYIPRDPSQTILYHVVADHLETFLASLDADSDAKGLPAYVQREFYDYLQCGILAHGFLRLGCDTCHHELLVPFSCKRRGYAEFRNMLSVSTQSRRKRCLRLQILRIFSHCGARRSACRAHETPHVSGLAVPLLQ